VSNSFSSFASKRNRWEVSFSAPSDKRLKENVKNIPVSKIRALFKDFKLKSFNFKIPKEYKEVETEKRTRYGFIAQEVKQRFEDLGLETKDLVYERSDGYLKLEYGYLNNFTIPAISDLYDIVEKQQSEIDLLKAEIKELKEAK